MKRLCLGKTNVEGEQEIISDVELPEGMTDEHVIAIDEFLRKSFSGFEENSLELFTSEM